jgi:hypothetical protein
MKKSKILSLALAVALVFALSVPAFALDGGTIGGDATVNIPTLNVTVPTSLDFALSPIVASPVGTGQVVAGNYVIKNSTADVAVLAAFYLDLDLDSSVTLAANATAVTDNYLLAATGKTIAFGIIPALTVASDAITTYALPATVEYFDTTNKTASVGFKLDAAGGTAPVSGFSFYAAANAYADWNADDIAVSGVYLLKALSTSTTVTEVVNTLKLINKTESPLPAKPDVGDFTPPPATPWYEEGTTYSTPLPALGNDAVIPFDSFDGTIVVKSSSGTAQAQGTVWVYDDDAKTLTIKASKLDAAAAGYSLSVEVSGGTNAGTFTLTFTARS